MPRGAPSPAARAAWALKWRAYNMTNLSKRYNAAATKVDRTKRDPPADAMKNARAGQVQYRADKTGIVQCTIGRASFTVDALVENMKALLEAVNKSRPTGIKGIYLKKVSVSSTMGVGVRIDQGGTQA